MVYNSGMDDWLYEMLMARCQTIGLTRFEASMIVLDVIPKMAELPENYDKHALLDSLWLTIRDKIIDRVNTFSDMWQKR